MCSFKACPWTTSLTSSVGVQAVTNETSPGVFGLFATDWFPVMVSAVLGSAEEAAQQGVHYLLLDVCLTCLNWPSIFPALHQGGAPGLPAGVQLAADALMDYLVSNAAGTTEPTHDCICRGNCMSSCISKSYGSGCINHCPCLCVGSCIRSRSVSDHGDAGIADYGAAHHGTACIANHGPACIPNYGAADPGPACIAILWCCMHCKLWYCMHSKLWCCMHSKT